MNTYLAVITTVLVLTQIIRVSQNAISLRNTKKRNDDIEKENILIREMNMETMEHQREIYRIIKEWEENRYE